MIKKLICMSVSLMLVLCIGGCGITDKTVGDGSAAVTRFQNAIELQKSVFTAEVLSVGTENAVITKYNFDISEYTVYTVEITDSIDGFTPIGKAKLYCAGTPNEFKARINLKKGEKYIIDAQPWIYGNETVYLLSLYTVAYPRIDSAGMVTLAQSDTEVLACGSFSEYSAHYTEAKVAAAKDSPDFFSPEKTLERFGEFVKEIYTKNTDDSAYSDERGYAWLPEPEHRKSTAERSAALYELYSRLCESDELTEVRVSEFITAVLGGDF